MGFMRSMKAKGKKNQAPARRKRGSSGLSKEDRIVKHNALVDYYAARRHAEELNAISSSSDDDTASNSSDVAANVDGGDANLAKLRALLGCAGGAAAAPAAATVIPRAAPGARKKADEDAAEYSDPEDLAAVLAAQRANGDFEDEEEAEEENEEDEEDADAAAGPRGKKANPDSLTALTTPGEKLIRVAHQAGVSGDVASDEDFDDDEDEMDPETAAALAAMDEGGLGELDGLDGADEEVEEGDEEADNDEDEEEGNDFLRREEGKSAGLGDVEDGQGDMDKLDAVAARATAQRFLVDTAPLSNLAQASRSELLQRMGVDAADTWLQKYAEDTCGFPDESSLTTEQAAVSASSVFPGLRVARSEAAAKAAAVIGAANARRAQASVDKKAKRGGAKDAPAAVPMPFGVHPAVWGWWLAWRRSLRAATPVDAAAAAASPDLATADWSEDHARLFDTIASYSDVYAFNRTWDNETVYIDCLALHAVNHWFKSRALSALHDAAFAQMNEDERAEADVRDRGFGRARVLIVLPMRNVALKYIQRLHDLVTVGSDAEANAANEGRFRTLTSDFSELPEAVDPSFKRRPTEFKRLFDGNINDTFCVGLALRPGTMRVYANVLESDIVVCSTLGLLKRMAKDADLSVALSSIEVAIVDMAHVILMQNWQHVRTILLRHLNRRPKDTTEGLNDLRRVFSWALKGQMRRHRQTIVVSDISHAQILQTMREGCANNSGRVVWTTPMTGVAGTGDGASGVLGAAPAKLRQQYVRFHASSVETVDDERFTHFTQKLFPTKIQPLVDRNVRVILYVPSYFDFVRVQAWLHEHHRFAYCAISEHSTPKEQRAALGQFTDQERQILVLTERFYFFQRYFVRLGEVLFFYSPPLFPSFYTHLLGKLALESPNAQGMVFYSRYDAHELARLVGAARTQQLLTRPAEAYLFLSDGAVAK